jgi:hypothetical protein
MTLCGSGLTCYWSYWECTALLSAWHSFTFSLQRSPGPITCQDNQRRPCFILVIEIENTLHLAAEIGGSDENFFVFTLSRKLLAKIYGTNENLAENLSENSHM